MERWTYDTLEKEVLARIEDEGEHVSIPSRVREGKSFNANDWKLVEEDYRYRFMMRVLIAEAHYAKDKDEERRLQDLLRAGEAP